MTSVDSNTGVWGNKVQKRKGQSRDSNVFSPVGFQTNLFSPVGSRTPTCLKQLITSNSATPRTGCQPLCKVRITVTLWCLRMGRGQVTGPEMPEEEEGKEGRMFGQLRRSYLTELSRISPSGPCTERTGCWKDIHPHLVWLMAVRTQTGSLTERKPLVRTGTTR